MDSKECAAALVGPAIDGDVLARESADRGDAGRVLGRIAAILDAFDQGEQVLTLIELSHRAHLPKSTVHRLAEQLRAVGWLTRDSFGYRVGLRLGELGGLAVRRNQLRDVAFPHLCTLAGRTGLPVQLGVLDRGEVVYLERILVGDHHLPTRLGGRMPAYCTGLGKAMLAFDDSATDEVTSSALPRRTERTLTEPSRLRSNLAEARRAGVAFDRAESYDGLGCVAAPIRNSGRAIAAVSVTGPLAEMSWDLVAKAVRRTAADIWTARFGAPRAAPAAGDTARRPHGPSAPGALASPAVGV